MHVIYPSDAVTCPVPPSPKPKARGTHLLWCFAGNHLADFCEVDVVFFGEFYSRSGPGVNNALLVVLVVQSFFQGAHLSRRWAWHATKRRREARKLICFVVRPLLVKLLFLNFFRIPRIKFVLLIFRHEKKGQGAHISHILHHGVARI